MAQKLKIAFINISQGQVNRGSEVFIAELAKRLSKDHVVDIISGNRLPGKRWPILWRFYLDPHAISILLFSLRQIPKILLKRYDIVIPLNGGWQSVVIRLITLMYGGRMVISGQSGFGWDDRINLWCYPNRFISLTKKGVEWSKRTNPFVRVEHIPNGVDTNKFSPGKPSATTELKKPIVLCVAALEKSKNIDLAIKAVAELKATSLLVIGDGSEREKIGSLGKSLLGERFLLDTKSHNEMPEIYKNASLFTLPSAKSEAIGIVYVEAMASGLGVVATDDEQRREIIGEAGIFVDPDNTTEYSDALKRGLNTDWGKKPQEQAQKFDWDKVAEKYEKLFNELIA